ncbi:hypothetical protein V7128_01065 [Neobacillus vireti]|uniref:hypothetical protein n=1 Tax=Neobacillus vireti TaxID=220686 RepID=UPI002FFF66C7
MDNLDDLLPSHQPHVKHIFEQIKNMMIDQNSDKQPSPSISAETSLPVQMAISFQNTRAAFMAFADAVIPSTLGALDLRIDDYMVWILDHFVSIQGEWSVKNFPLSSQTARILDIAAYQLIASGNIKVTPDYSSNPDGGPFLALSPNDRFEAIRLLENQQVDLEVLPPPYRNNGGLVKNVITSLHQMVMFGYYSEWFSLGSTRQAYPEDQRIERQPFLWESLGYPGPSFGYRAVRGFLVDKFSE